MGIICTNIEKNYIGQDGKLTAVANTSFRIEEQEFVSIVGPSGCGKTTLLKIIAGLLKPDAGQVTFEQEPSPGQSLTAMVFQDQALFPWDNVVDNVSLALAMKGCPKKERYKIAMAFLKKVGLDGFAKSYPHELSGGMKQRVALLRAFLADPLILLMDEPFGALDAQTRIILQNELLRIWRENKKTVLFVTHDIEEAIMLSDRILVMSDRPGRIQEEINIEIERPRDLVMKDNKIVKELKWHIWKMLESEVRKNLNFIP